MSVKPNDVRSLLVTSGLAALVLTLDLAAGAAFGNGAIYVLVLLVSLSLPWRRSTTWVAAVCTVLILLGGVWTVDGSQPWSATGNRLISMALVWLTALLLIHRKKLEGSLSAVVEGLEREAARRHEDRERFQRLIEFAPIAFLIVDGEGRIQFANQQAEQLFGQAASELLGRHYTVLVPDRLHDLHREYQAGFFATMQPRTLGTGSELLAKRKDGTEFPVEVGLTPLVMDARVMVLGAVVDVSERKRSAQALLDSERRLRSILQSALDAVIMMDDQGRITFWNPQAESIFGYSADEAIGRDLAQLIIPESIRSAHVAGLEGFRATKSGTVFNRRLELTALRRNGDEFPVELTVQNVTIGEKHEFSAFVRDITERRRSEAAVRDSQARLSRVLEASGAGIWEWNIKTGEMLFSDSWLESMGYARSDLVPHVTTCEQLLQPDDLVRIRAELKHHFQNQTPAFRCESRMRTKSGAYRWNLDVGKVVEWDADGQPYRMVGCTTDVTERRRANDRFRLAVESAPSGMLMVDPDGLIVLVNSEAERLFGYSREELLGQSVDMLVPVRMRQDHPQHRAKFFADPHARAMGAGRDLFGVRRDGSEFPIEIGLNPIEAEDGLMVLSAIVDITERKRAQEWLQDMNRTLERRVEERTHLIALLKDVAATCNQAESVRTAFAQVLERVCQYLGWSYAHAFLFSENLAGAIATSDLWFPEQSIPVAIRQDQSFRSRFLAGEGITGQVLKRGVAQWTTDVTEQSEHLHQTELATLGIRAIFSMPVKIAERVVAVLEFWNEMPFPPNDGLLAIADQLGGLLGRVIERDELQRAVAESVEAEQRRIGHELHDGLGQELTALSLLSRSIATTLKSEGSAAADKADQFARSIPQLVREIRAVIRGLMPVELDANGLMSALQQLADSTEQRHGITCRLEANQAVPVKNLIVAHHLFRIAQEAINNALKHARSESIILSLRGDDSMLDLCIHDDGDGVGAPSLSGHESPRPGMGMRIMRHRASLIGASLTIQSPPHGGTLVRCRLTEKDSSNDG
jgi:PAS domain S-box-containing protein